jgi:hypothetical protein
LYRARKEGKAVEMFIIPVSALFTHEASFKQRRREWKEKEFAKKSEKNRRDFIFFQSAPTHK